LEGYSNSLNKLVLLRADTPIDHVQYWLLLLSLGKKNLALKEAQSYPFPPGSPEEVVAMSQAYFALGLKDMAVQFVQRFIASFEDDANLWISYANLLIANKSWEPLSLASVQIRQNIMYFPALESYSYLLEGLANNGLRRFDFAEQSFTSMLKCKSFDPQLGCSMAELLLKNGYPKYARDLLEKLKDLKPDPLVYWPLLFSVAHELKDDQLLFKAAETVYAIEPKNWIVRNNYAAALIILRKRPEEAVKLTLPFLLSFPEANVSKINHSMALLQNQRFSEAETILKSIPISRLNDVERNAYHLAMVELLLNKKDYASAKQSCKLLDTNQLFPSEKLWLGEAQKILFPTNTSTIRE
jgi:tetratricopeptide (TPR) repeat protein